MNAPPSIVGECTSSAHTSSGGDEERERPAVASATCEKGAIGGVIPSAASTAAWHNLESMAHTLVCSKRPLRAYYAVAGCYLHKE